MTVPDSVVTRCKVADNCVKCRHGVPHAPLLAVYDLDAGDYAFATERICMARWASTNHNHGQGQICGLPMFREAGDVDLCEHHYERVVNWRYFERPVEDIKAKIRAIEEADREYAEAVERSQIHQERIDAAKSVVYYIRRTSDGMIKIGTTAAFGTRMSTHRAQQGEIQILLTHSGTMADERRMHRKFEAYRDGRSEWFRPMKPLLRWIYEARQVIHYRETQQRGAMRLGELRKLMVAAESDPKWRGGKRV